MFKAVLIDAIEDKIIEHYAVHQLTTVERDALGQVLGEELIELREETVNERASLLRRKSRLLTEREKLLQAHYAEAVPLDLLKSEQARIGEALNHIEQRFAETARLEERQDSQLNAALALATDTQIAYQGAPDAVRRKINQAMFKKIIVEEGGELSSVLVEPFDLLLSPEVRQLAVATPLAVAGLSPAQTTLAPTTKAPAGWRAPRVGLNKEALVGAGGFEPP